MKLVIVKHDIDSRNFLFQVPIGMILFAGELVLVQTKKGEALATCVCNDFRIDENSREYQRVLSSFGIKEVTGMVIGKYRLEMTGA